MKTRVTGAALAVLLAFAAVAGSAAVASAWMPGPKPKAIVLKASPGTSSHGQPVKLALALTPKGGGQPQGGTVTFRTGETVLGTATATKRITTITTTALPVGEPTVTATYSGDPRVAAATSNSVVVVVGPARTTTTLTTAGPVEVGQRAELRAAVRRGGIRPTGTVTFTAGRTRSTVPLNANGVATWRPLLPEGTHSVTASYDGTDTDASSESASVAQAVAVIDHSYAAPAGEVITDTNMTPWFMTRRTGLLTQIELTPMAPYGPATVSIHRSNEGPLPTALGSATLTSAGDGTPARLTFDPPIPVEYGDAFALVIPTSGALSFAGSTESTYGHHSGVYAFIRGSYSERPGWNLSFRTWVVPTA